jgi:hypothetical protein
MKEIVCVECNRCIGCYVAGQEKDCELCREWDNCWLDDRISHEKKGGICQECSDQIVDEYLAQEFDGTGCA